MTTKILSIFTQETDDEKLEIFFLLMKTYNNRQKLDRPIIDDITDFLKFKWDNDKNNFLENEEDHIILHKLS